MLLYQPKKLNNPNPSPLLETGSDYLDLVRETGLEPVRQRHTHLKRACLPVPALAQLQCYYIT